MHYNNSQKRNQIIRELGNEVFFGTRKKIRGFIQLCIYPYDWEVVFNNIQRGETIRVEDWNCLLGFLYGVHVLIKRRNKYTFEAVVDMAPDFVDFIRNSPSEKENPGYAWRFAVQVARNYMYRYIPIKGLTRFGVDWRSLAVTHMGATRPPNPRTFSSLLTNKYVRSLVKAMTVFRTYYKSYEEGYEPGVNDIVTLLEKHSSSSKCIDYEPFQNTVEYLNIALPSWNHSIRNKVGYYMDFNLPLTDITEISYEKFSYKI